MIGVICVWGSWWHTLFKMAEAGEFKKRLCLLFLVVHFISGVRLVLCLLFVQRNASLSRSFLTRNAHGSACTSKIVFKRSGQSCIELLFGLCDHSKSSEAECLVKTVSGRENILSALSEFNWKLLGTNSLKQQYDQQLWNWALNVNGKEANPVPHKRSHYTNFTL